MTNVPCTCFFVAPEYHLFILYSLGRGNFKSDVNKLTAKMLTKNPLLLEKIRFMLYVFTIFLNHKSN